MARRSIQHQTSSISHNRKKEKNIPTNSSTTMGNKVATINIGIGPWNTYENAVKHMNSGDILLLSARNMYGRSIRFLNRTLYSSVGIIVKSKLMNEVYVLEVSIERESLYQCYYAKEDCDRKLMFGTQLQPLRSILSNGLYDLVAYRKVEWRRDVDVSHLMRDTFSTQKEFPVVNYDPNIDDYITSRLLNFSTNRTQVLMHPGKFKEVFSSMFQNGIILAASVDDLRCLASAELVATIYFKLGIFQSEQYTSLIPKFIAGHFSSYSPYELPFNKEMVLGFNKENYIYLDHQVWQEDIVIPNAIEFPEAVPGVQSSLIQLFNTDPIVLNKLKLKTGDLMFFKEEGAVGEATLQTAGGNYSRVCMVMKIPNINKIFLLDTPNYYITKAELQFPRPKLLEQRLVSLEGVLTGGPFSRVAIRRLAKTIPVPPVNHNVYAYLELNDDPDDPFRLRMQQVFNNLNKDFENLFRIDVSSILSGYFVTMAYQQLGLLESDANDSEKWLNMTPLAWESQTLAKGYALSEEEVLSGRLMRQFNII
jgi:hypothetical protein